MTERQRKFREQYLAQISPLYNGLVHIGVMYTTGIAAIWWSVSRMHNPTWEWLLILPRCHRRQFRRMGDAQAHHASSARHIRRARHL